ncbi:MAG: UDP-N-acetylmuramoyl-L-alanyl-D-glutamate--2,6-diaminopimelate ligase [Clostridium sp.]|nr:UDP-N-acetylmuramoyl-L-alanyl-D-glutamate--2,6-diaminopimelate ligase [Clostridium sp.]MCM1398221.1 UDP-N-acetylmuramoyl-L-alanyl-D-glutamate--2,6-diaminopimelate ligase [Clostridium sp.]MCM1460365.1 UDP-N-acetylmuramoyl-L-alanyl-D-glutamate--2,6-diaminopimelate ligase [Bacteroides sp.]
MKLSELLHGFEYEILCGSPDTEVFDIKNDSRLVGEGDLFFCIAGAVSDGHKYAEDVIKKGASVLIVEKEIDAAGAVIVRVENSRKAMGMISSRFYGEPSKKLTVIGITGTKGKTTTTYMIKEMLEAAGKKTGLIGTIEIIDGKNHIHAKNTTPESLELHKKLKDMVENGLSCVVMEVSSQGLMLDRVSGVDFDYAIYTNLSKDHIGPNEHSSFEEYRMWKSKLFAMCRVGIINVDDSHADYMINEADCEIVTYGMNHQADYKANSFGLYSGDGVLGIGYDLSGRLEGHIEVDLPGEFSVHNSLAAVAIADLLGVPFDNIRDILKKIKVRGRVEMIPISDAFTIMIDYAHNAMALESLLCALKSYEPARIVTVFGCGGDRARDRRFEMGEVSGKLSDFTIITSDNPRFEEPLDIIKDIKTGIEKTDGAYIEIPDRKEAMRYAIMNAKKGDVIVFAGKGHEDYQEIKGVKHHMDERDLIREILEEEDVTKICGYNNRYFA